MKYLLLLGLVALRTLAVAAPAEVYVPFRADLPAGTAYTIDARALHPTQFALGFREVRHKAAIISRKDAAGLVAYLKRKNVPVVIGPGGVPYLTDGHHTMRALLESTQTDYGHIIANWSDLPFDAFWARMRATNSTYLNDAEGRGPLDPALLPDSLLAMQSNRYRGLGWAGRCSKLAASRSARTSISRSFSGRIFFAARSLGTTTTTTISRAPLPQRSSSPTVPPRPACPAIAASNRH